MVWIVTHRRGPMYRHLSQAEMLHCHLSVSVDIVAAIDDDRLQAVKKG